MESGSGGETGYWALLRGNRNFRLLYIGTLISLAGDWFLTVALLDLVLELSGLASLASLMVVCQTIPVFLVTPFAGHLADKLDRRKLMITTDVIRAFACLLPLLATSRATLPFAFLGVIVIAVGSACFEPASAAALPNLVAEGELGRANVLFGSAWGTMLAVGAALGGLVTARFGRNVSFLSDALSFLLSALLLYLVKASFSEVRSHEHPPFLKSVRETFGYARNNPRVLALLVSKGGYGIGAGVVAMLSVFGRQVFHAGAYGIGLLYATRGIGALAGPFILRGISKSNDQQYRWISAAVALFGLGYIGLASSGSLLIGSIAICLAHLGGGAQWLTSTFGLQREVPDHIRGRVFAVDYGLVTLTMSFSSLLVGTMSDRFGPRPATAATASLCIAWAVGWGVLTWKLWKPRESVS
ncbi:MAG TPA: MFS transporter [Thermoanaerobaculia bacterium]|nr:MFS transporter [Thermoanaerobaculia bacterium]